MSQLNTRIIFFPSRQYTMHMNIIHYTYWCTGKRSNLLDSDEGEKITYVIDIKSTNIDYTQKGYDTIEGSIKEGTKRLNEARKYDV